MRLSQHGDDFRRIAYPPPPKFVQPSQNVSDKEVEAPEGNQEVRRKP